MTAGDTELMQRARQGLYWRLMSALFEQGDAAPNLETLARELANTSNLPTELLDPKVTVDVLVHRFPKLKPEFSRPLPGFSPRPSGPEGELPGPDGEVPQRAEAPTDLKGTVQRALVVSKLLLNAFGPNTQGSVTAQQYGAWARDVEWLEGALGLPPGSLRQSGSGGGHGSGPPSGGGGEATRPPIGDEELKAGLATLEADMIHRMDLREVLKDPVLCERLTPSMALLEQILWDKGNLSGPALQNAKRLIARYVDELSKVLKLQMRQVTSRVHDNRVPPRRIFRNLDMKRTVWKNLTNWDPKERRLYVDRLFFRRTGKKSLPTKLIIIVDQSGSMTSAMVQTTILASIFAALPKVIVHLFAFDTRVIDLTPYVHDPVETLLRTKLGGGNDMRLALDLAAPCIDSPQNTAVVVISDFYDWSDFFSVLRQWKESGCHLIPVGSLHTTGYFSVNPEYSAKFKAIGAPVLSGSPKKLIEQIKKVM
ncbi:VWA domain-containing protein [Nannocystis sp. SCPEA4]|uniref:vWA domain-containing protein n=1 Tax=Nannocystis sp. SCPEA4 TaxID=2996787 RepID=UPI00226EC884|nr:VWA domain-containing protein [Nannocystis sp. SCPEA4]MCY1055145.1 VWA domain-containing protein [Nannocystis sp. SCPEA4]